MRMKWFMCTELNFPVARFSQQPPENLLTIKGALKSRLGYGEGHQIKGIKIKERCEGEKLNLGPCHRAEQFLSCKLPQI